MNQPNLFDFDEEEGERQRDDAFDRVSQPDKAKKFQAEAHPLIIELAQKRDITGNPIPFTTDDFWAIYGPYDGERRSLGPVLHGLARSGVIRKTGSTEKSAMTICHRRDKAMWVGTKPC